jgi:hypothetical protein
VNPSEILKRLEVDAVLLPIRRGTKRPNRKEWQKLSFADTQEPNFQRSLASASAIGVLLGRASGGLCSIDFDDDEFLKRFLEMNAKLKGTLRTTARRGANLWIVLEGTPPPSRKLVFEGTAVGEFRSDNSQTLIAGLHPVGGSYQRLVDAPPLRLPYGAIQWPEGVEGAPPPPTHFSQSSEYSQSLHTLNPLHNIRERMKGREDAEKELSGNSSLSRLYRMFVAKRFTPRQGNRNQDLVAMVAFLFRAVGKTQAIALSRAFHQTNQDIFHDPLEQHLREAEAHYAACERDWRSSLSESEKRAVESLPDSHAEAFRVCRDLAAHQDQSSTVGDFFLSYNDLADRLGLHPPQAQRILLVFESGGWIEITEKGTRHTKGQPGRATRYRWNFKVNQDP